MSIPPEYHGREQTYLKHQVLRKYLQKWAFKLGSTSRFGKRRLWYIDCFAGPWKSKTEDIRDTSVSIALQVLNEVLDEWRGKYGTDLSVHAIFVEQDPESYEALKEHVATHRGAVVAEVLRGTFGEQVEAIRTMIGDDAAFIFVDPTGWKGAGMEHVARLVDRKFRDVIINLMYQYINRFKNEDRRQWLIDQLCEFFGLDDPTEIRGLDEEELIALYRRKLKEMGGLAYALDLAIPDPTRNRTFFHLVIGGHHHDVVKLFRTIEAEVVGKMATSVREDARQRKDEARSGQLALGLGPASSEDARYSRNRDRGLQQAREIVEDVVSHGPIRFGDVWPTVLEQTHITLQDLKQIIGQLQKEDALIVEGMRPRERTVKDDHVLRHPAGE